MKSQVNEIDCFKDLFWIWATLFTFTVYWKIFPSQYMLRKLSRRFYILSTVVNFSPYLRKGKDKASCPVFVYRWGASKAIRDLVLYLLSEGWNMSLVYNGLIPSQYLKTVAAMQDSTLPKTGSQFISLKWARPMWEGWGKCKQKRIYLFCAVWSLRFRILLRSRAGKIYLYAPDFSGAQNQIMCMSDRETTRTSHFCSLKCGLCSVDAVWMSKIRCV